MGSLIKILAAVLSAVLCGSVACAQFNTTAQSARSGALGGSFIVGEERGVELSYLSRYLLPELAEKRISLFSPLGKRGYAECSYMHHGTTDYHEQQLSASYRIAATDWLAVGVGARYLHLGVDDVHYQSCQYVAADVVMLLSAGKRTSFRLLAGTRPWDDAHPFRGCMQMTYRPGMNLMTLMSVESEERVRKRMGLEYSYDHFLFLRAGMYTAPLTVTFGVGVRWKNVSCDIAAEAHNILGISPQTTLVLWF